MSVKLIINCNTKTDYSEEKVNKLNNNQIPYFANGDAIWFLSRNDIEFSTNDSSGKEFIIDMLSDNPKFHLGGEFSNFNETIQKVLIDVFGQIQLDINLIDGYSGDSDWLDFRLNSDFTFDYMFESDDDD